MDKPAPVLHPVHPFVVSRWSPRAFSPEPIGEEALRSLFEAARWAPSSHNEQPWSWIVATNSEPEDFAKLLSCLVEFNQMWAGRAPVLAIAIARDSFAKNGNPNPHAGHDVGQAAAWLTMEATSRGLIVHQMAGFLPERVRELFLVPPGYTPLTAIAIGRAGDPSQLPDFMQKKEQEPRQRRALSESVFSGSFGQGRKGF